MSHHSFTSLSYQLIKAMTLNTYELTSLNADLLFQNNLYSQVTNRQVSIQGLEKTEQSRLVFYFDKLSSCLVL